MQAYQSEVATLLARIEQEYEAGKAALSGLAYGTSQHDFITRRMERMSELHEELHTLVGDASVELMINYLDSR